MYDSENSDKQPSIETLHTMHHDSNTVRVSTSYSVDKAKMRHPGCITQLGSSTHCQRTALQLYRKSAQIICYPWVTLGHCFGHLLLHDIELQATCRQMAWQSFVARCVSPGLQPPVTSDTTHWFQELPANNDLWQQMDTCRRQSQHAVVCKPSHI